MFKTCLKRVIPACFCAITHLSVDLLMAQAKTRGLPVYIVIYTIISLYAFLGMDYVFSCGTFEAPAAAMPSFRVVAARRCSAKSLLISHIQGECTTSHTFN